MDAVKVYISEDELYPVYAIEFDVDESLRHFYNEVDVDPETLERWQGVHAAFYAVQEEIYDAIQATKPTGDA